MSDMKLHLVDVILITIFATLNILNSIAVLNEHAQLIISFVAVFYGFFYGAKTGCHTARSFRLVCGFPGQLILLIKALYSSLYFTRVGA